MEKAESLKEKDPFQGNREQSFLQNKVGKKLLVVTNREPITFTGKKITHPAGGVSQSLHHLLGEKGGTWIAAKNSEGPDQIQIDSAGGPGYRLERITLPSDLKSAFYEGFSNDVLWPAFHGCPEFMAPSPSFFKSYDEVNHIFAKTILSTLIKGNEHPDIIWIHDYHLTLTASWLRKETTTVLPPLAFFLHIPWPSSERLKYVREYKEILAGLLSYDLIGFQTEQDKINFLQAVSDYISDAIVAMDGSIYWSGRMIKAVSMPIGVDPALFGRMAQNPRNIAKAHHTLTSNGLGNHFQFLISADRMDYTKGFIHRLEILRNLFLNYPHLKGKLSLLQIAVPTRTGQETYRAHQEKIREGVLSLNQEFGTATWSPIISLEETFDQETLSGLYSLASGALITSTMDGMNLVSQEFLASQSSGSGVLFLSQYTGTASILSNCTLIDPYRPEESAKTIAHELSQPDEEKRRKNALLLREIQKHDLNHWLNSLESNIAIFFGQKQSMVA